MKDKKIVKAGLTSTAPLSEDNSQADAKTDMARASPFDLVADEAACPYDIITELYAYHDRLLEARSKVVQTSSAPSRLALTQSDQILLSEIEDMLRDPRLAQIARPVFRDALGWIAERALQQSDRNV